MRVLFVNMPSETPIIKAEREYSLGLLYLESILHKKGHGVIVKDYYFDTWEIAREQVLKKIKENTPEVLGLSCVTMNRTACFRIARIIKELYPKIKIIMGGIHSTYMYQQILLNLPIDVIVMGEGEETTPELIEALEKGKSLKKILGLAFKKNNKVYFTGFRKPIHDLDALPFPRHELFADILKKTKSARIISSRGCPFCCIFCSTSVFWGRRWRPRSAKNVVDEIEYISQKLPYVEKIFFQDDTFIADNQRVVDICEDIIKRGIKIKWSCSGRVDRVTKEMLIKMKEAGCTSIGYGVESGSPRMLKVINKKITTEQIERTIAITNEVGLPYYTYLMVGNPGESWETIKETVEFLKKLKNLEVESVGKLEIYPNTGVYELAKKQGLIEDSFWLTEKKVPHYTYEHSEDELTKMAYYIVEKNQLQKGILNFMSFSLRFFFDKPKKALRYLLLKLGNIKYLFK